jgi:hypothetical protein
MTLNRFITYSFDKWWRPVLLLFVAGFLLTVSIWTDVSFLQVPSFILLCIAVFILGLSLIYQLWKKRWINAILTLLLLGGTVAAGVFYTIVLFFIITMDTPDRFADNLKIPTHITINNPIDMGFEQKKPDSISNVKRHNIDFQLYNSFQPGLYEYDFWTSKIDSGTIYIKAFEITKNYPLSRERLPRTSSVKVFNPKDSIVKVGTTSHFTIYEGDWDKPYAARFEIWYKPAIGGHETKLFEKNYKIEGWMR